MNSNKTLSLKSIYTYVILGLIVIISACSITQRVKDGTMAYERKQYSVATDMLTKEFNKSKYATERGQLAFLLGRSWTALGENEKAIDWYKKAYDNAFGEDALIQQAYALKMDEQYEEAAKAFKAVGLETGDPFTFRKEESACVVAAAWKNTPVEERSFDIQPSEVNTTASEYAPVFYNSDLVFTSDREAANGDDTYKWTGRNFSDIFIEESSVIRTLDGPFNTKHNDGTISYNADLTYAVFTRCFTPTTEDQFCQLLETKFENGAWSAPEPLPFLKDGVNYGQPSVTEDGNAIYFSSNHSEGWGGMDIYRVSKTDGKWNEPVILPLRLNTIEDEQFPYTRQDTLYFASSGHGGMGGLDIYKTYVRSNGTWAPVENLKYPINSGGDDFGFIIRNTRQGEKLSEGYFSSNRKNGKGGDDIYKFTEKTPVIPEPEIVVKEETATGITEVKETHIATNKIIGYVTSDAYSDNNDPNSKIKDSTTPVSNATVIINYSGTPINATTDNKGYFERIIDTDGNYIFTASADGYLNNSINKQIKFKSEEGVAEQLFKVNIKLDRIFKNVEINLDNIYYEFNKANIQDDAKPTLLKLTTLLNQNPQIRIQLSAHTDCRGPVAYNQDLSQRRAQSVVDFLLSQGIDTGRMIAKGYGSSRPADTCNCDDCSEDQHQANRRTTFTIIE